MLKETLGTITGIQNSVSGNDPSLNKGLSGAALVLLESQTIRFLSSLQASYSRLIEGVGSSMIDILKTYAKKPKLMRIAGADKAFAMKEFSGADLDGFDRIAVEQGSPNMNSPAVNLQI